MAEANPPVSKEFDPVSYSIDENKFILAHAGEPPQVALSEPIPGVGTYTYGDGPSKGRTVQTGPSRKAIADALTRIYEFVEMEKHRGQPWCGVAAIKAAITTYLEQTAKWEKDARTKGAPRHPSMFVFTDKGLPISQGVGADAGRVRTYFDANGQRHPFAVSYQGENVAQWTAPWVAAGKPANEPTGSVIEEPGKSRLECPVCGHTESYNTDSSSSKNAAKARMSRHLKSDKRPELVDAHREALIKEFGGKGMAEGQ